MSDYMLGVDIGTTSTKAVLFDADGHVVAHRTVGYPLLTPTPATAEQDPEEIYRAVLAANRSVRNSSRLWCQPPFIWRDSNLKWPRNSSVA
jgi:gluconokinase